MKMRSVSSAQFLPQITRQLVLVCCGTRGDLEYSSSPVLPPQPALIDRPQNMVLKYSDH